MNLLGNGRLRLGAAIMGLCVSTVVGQSQFGSTAAQQGASAPTPAAAAAPVAPKPAPPPPNAYLDFVRAEAARYQAGRAFPKDTVEWEKQKVALRGALMTAWGGFPSTSAKLQPRVLGELRREGYRVEKLVFQTLPGVLMTANAYVPDAPGRHPAVLAVHGHWPGAKQDPVVQARCIGLVKQGFFVLVVDALGAGERAVGKALGEYHGDTTAATLWPLGRALAGLQLYENIRAVDYLRTRPEVDPARIGITGASGGGNQTMYAGAWDSRLSAVVAVCSVGNYPAYLGRACCMCEVVPGALSFADEWAVLGLIAPRALMVVSATQDSPVFSSAAARVTMEPVERLFALVGKSGQVRHTHFESLHDYSQPMREAMYGWMTRELYGEGDGAPLSEPALKPEDPEALRCYPGETRPDDFVTIPRFAAAEARRLLAARRAPTSATAWKAESARRLAALTKVFGGTPGPVALEAKSEPVAAPAAPAGARRVSFVSEAGIALAVELTPGRSAGKPLVVLLDFDTIEKTGATPLAVALR
ncbi:MAG TPA: alpha/beta hydrolase family protein, partial [Opitutaceae bacterium]